MELRAGGIFAHYGGIYYLHDRPSLNTITDASHIFLNGEARKPIFVNFILVPLDNAGSILYASQKLGEVYDIFKAIQ